ncbi:MAG: xanthine dehydrogenase family protein molybdopterin-binding subunit [Candidatus Methanofastidiosia archaeon]
MGTRIRRPDANEKVTGKIKYTSDLKFPGMLYGKVLRSPHPHARIMGIDYSKAKELTGVVDVIIAEDIPNNEGIIGLTIADCGVLASNKVRYIGDAVAAVAAVNEEIAEKALKLIKVKYEVLPAVFDPEVAMKPEAPQIHEGYENPQYRGHGNIVSNRRVIKGDVEKGFKEADYIVEDRFTTQPVDQTPMEREAFVSSYEPGGTLTVWAKTQAPYWERVILSRALGLPQHRIHILANAVGGGFGGCFCVRLLYICAALARKVGKGIPVKMVNTREEEFVCSTIRHPSILYFKTGVKKDGTITARQLKTILENGAYTDSGDLVSAYIGETFAGTYNASYLRYDAYTVYTNNPFGGAYRGYGNPQLTLGLEQHIEHVAETLGMDFMEFRLKNAMETGDFKADGTEVKSCGLKDCIKKVAEELDWKNKKGKRIRNGKKVRGVGIACGAHASGWRGGFDTFIWRAGYKSPEELYAVNPDSPYIVQKPDGSLTWREHYDKIPRYDSDASLCVLRLNEDGTVNLEIGEIEYGQGLTTTVAIIVAEELGIGVEDIKVRFGDTGGGAWGAGSFASRVTMIGGRAVLKAARKAKIILFKYASKLLGFDPEDLEARDRKIYVRGTDKFCHIEDAAFLAYAGRDGGYITVTGYYDADDSVIVDLDTGQGCQSVAYIYFASGMEVEVDTETGEIKVLKSFGAYDAGKIINPVGAEGQIEGSTGQGMGFALTEDLGFENGRVRNTSFSKYGMSTSVDMPATMESIFVETHEKSGPYGAKGLGEPGHVPQPAAIANAVYDAIGVRLDGIPLTPAKVLAALENQKTG